MRILLVEDHRDTADVLSRLLSASHHNVTLVRTAADAERLCLSRPFDLLLCDISLPDRDGWDLMTRLRQRCGIKAIAISGYGTESDVARSQAAGFAAHLTKPLTFQRLLDAINVVTDASSGDDPDVRRTG